MNHKYSSRMVTFLIKFQNSTPAIQKSLFNIVLSSRSPESPKPPNYIKFASSNALTILNSLSFPLCSLDLSRLYLPHCQLRNCCLDFSNFEYSNLNSVNFINCKMDHVNFKHSLMTKVIINLIFLKGEIRSLPNIEESHEKCQMFRYQS